MDVNHVFSEIGHGMGVVAKDVVKGAEEALSVGGKVLRVIADARAVTPEFKSSLESLVDDVKTIAAPLAPVVASGGENIAADMAAIVPVVQDVMKLVKDFIAFLPSIEAALKLIDADLES